MFDIKEELKKLPAKPGVYLMHDKSDAIIYVGKAISLKNRVRQYFQAGRRVSPKIERMISQIDHFEYIITDSEVEALVLENNLIKEYEPKYNTMLKDDKTYPYIKATVYEDFPRLIYSRQPKKDKCKYFGPFTNVTAARDTLEFAHKIYRIRTCRRVLPRDIGKERPCLNYHIGKCNAPCQGYISKEEYNKNFNKALKLIEGDYKQVIEYLEEKMYEASEKMEYEQAAVCRDLIESVKKMSVKQKINDFGGMDRDVVALARTNEEAVVQVFFIREGKLIGRDHFHLKGSYGEKENDMLQAFIKQFYAGTPFIPREVMVEYEVTESELIEKWLSEKRGGKVSIIVPKKGQKERLVELAHKNAAMVLTKDMEKIKREEERTTGAMKQISGWLGLEDASRVESYDISNISGFLSVGSMVVFDDGKPKKSEYRKFRIKTVEGPNDYASMYEVLKRRFSHGLMEIEQLNEKNFSTEFGSFTKFPDLIMMDGGVGQVHIAMQVLSELDIDIPVCGMVKDDNHRTRGLFFDEHEIPIDTNSEGFRLMTRIQDEVHRFAIEYHRSLRSKEQVKSILDDIPGIGEKRRKALMKHFASIEAIKNAAIDELAQVESMNEKAAASVYKFFHQGGAKE
ncbi:excinuclease ABC subunit UvrC [Butyribacter intestini]|uniref:UvrABC system protein C n=1 Tax=Butyribacter intestini TaxID=1703332 RepID=A0AAW3JTD1_9FIRM|nr:excinuclease ABC subunit UvrC [Butyribacter intestini]KQC85888.1 excinuclease ABC subunit C [Butyribacter intestini]RHU76987.1 excinuclease ABC subunit UvrC [Butyribacter intestini]